MQTLKKAIGFAEIAFAIIAAFLCISLLVGLFRDDRFAGEWGFLLIPIDFVIAATFGWAGYALVTDKPRTSLHQSIPAVAVVIIVAFLFWADSI